MRTRKFIDYCNNLEEVIEHTRYNSSLVIRSNGSLDYAVPDDTQFTHYEIIQSLTPYGFVIHELERVKFIYRSNKTSTSKKYNELATQFLIELDNSLLDTPFIYGDVMVCQKHMVQ